MLVVHDLGADESLRDELRQAMRWETSERPAVRESETPMFRDLFNEAVSRTA